MNIILCGYKSSGKSTVGKALASALHFSFIDTDQLILKRVNQMAGPALTIAEVHQQLGDTVFRAIEAEEVAQLQQVQQTVIATGGGTVLNRTSVERLQRVGKLIYLRLNPEIIYQRFLNDNCFPSFLAKDNLKGSLEKDWAMRDKIYSAIADKMIAIGNYSVQQSVDTILQ